MIKQDSSRHLNEMPDTDTSSLSKQAKELKEDLCLLE